MSVALEMGPKMRDDAVDRRAGRHHHSTRRGRSRTAMSLSGASALPIPESAGCPAANACVFACVEVVARDREAPARDVAREVRAHHAQADDTDLVT